MKEFNNKINRLIDNLPEMVRFIVVMLLISIPSIGVGSRRISSTLIGMILLALISISRFSYIKLKSK